MLFAQSREIHRNVKMYYESDLFSDPAIRPQTYFDDTRVAMMFCSGLYHDQLFDAFESNPLSTMLSLTWTVCSTSFNISPKMRDSEYMSVWSPFICLVNALCYLNDKAENRSDVRPCDLFDLDDLRQMDRDFIRSIKEQAQLDPADQRRKNDERERSSFFHRLLENTPFGTYQIVDTPTDKSTKIVSENEWKVNGQRFTFVASPINVIDLQRYLAMIARCESTEKIRLQTEARLRERFHAYHSMYGLNVDAWLIATHEKNVDGSRALLWQVQKSSLVWWMYHLLAALVIIIDKNELVGDFLATVKSIENFIECGLCANHWRTSYKGFWANFINYREDVLETSEKISNRTEWPSWLREDAVDLRLLRTHNDVQKSIDPRFDLTEAALHALREDYLNAARTLVAAVSVRGPATTTLSKHRLVNGRPLSAKFNCSIYTQEQAREDVCRTPFEISRVFLRNVEGYSKDRRGSSKKAQLRLEWENMHADE